MKLTTSAAAALACEPGLTGTDLKIWLLLVDNPATSAELARMIGTAPANTSTACRKLLYAGWVDMVEQVGKAKRYKARSTRNENAAIPGQTELF